MAAALRGGAPASVMFVALVKRGGRAIMIGALAVAGVVFGVGALFVASRGTGGGWVVIDAQTSASAIVDAQSHASPAVGAAMNVIVFIFDGIEESVDAGSVLAAIRGSRA